MSHAPPSVARPLPGWLVLLASLVVVFHLFALGIYILAAPSGPWPNGMGGVTMVQGPQFAFSVNNVLTPYYLRYLKMTHNYHYMANRPSFSGVKVEVKLRDDKGNVFRTVELPDPKANFWVQQRQLTMIRGLAEDQPVEVQMETIAAPGKKAKTLDIWERGTGGGQLKIISREEHLIPRDQPVMRPSAYARILASSMSRYLCRHTGAATAEVLRISREPVPPMALTPEFDAPPEAFTALTSNFGEISK